MEKELSDFLDRHRTLPDDELSSLLQNRFGILLDASQEAYLSHLAFSSSRMIEDCMAAYPEQLFTGMLGERIKWMGVCHEREILSGSMARVSVEKVDDTVGFGLFASEDLPAYSYVGEYTGVVTRRKRFFQNTNDFCFTYPTKRWSWKSYMIDSSRKGNLMRFMNHSDTPTVVPEYALVHGVLHIIFFTAKALPKGSQLTFHYGDAYWRNREKIAM